MNLLEPIEGDRVAGPQDYFQALTDYETPLGKYLGAKLGQGWWNSWGGQIVAGASLPENALFRIGGEPAKAVLGLIPPAKHAPGYATNPPPSQLPHDVILHRLNALPEDERKRVLPQVEQALKQRGLKFYTEDEWRNSEHHRDMPFEPFMTVERAKAKAEIYDANRAREWLIAHRPDGALSGTLGFLAGTVGGLADPTTLAGGIGGKLVMNLGRAGAANLFKAGGIGVADGAISSLAHDYSLRQSLAKWGEHTTDGEIWENAGWAALIGGGLGGTFQGARMLRAKPGEPGSGSGRTTVTNPTAANGPPVSPAGISLNPPTPASSAGGTAQIPIGSGPGPAKRPTGALGNSAIEQLLDPMSPAAKYKLFDSAVQDFIDNGYRYRADQVYNRGNSAPSSKLVLKDTTPINVDKDGRRSFTSTDKHVADRANAIERDNPGHVVCTNCKLIDPNTGIEVGEIDILTRNAIIQVKSRGGKGLTDQVLRYEKLTGFPTIGYGPDLKGSIVRGIQDVGGLVTKDKDLLDKVVKP